MVSKELSVMEVMQVMKGEELSAINRLQPCLFQFLRHKLLNGAIPTKSKKQEAVATFLANCEEAIRAVEVRCSLLCGLC